MLETSNEYQAMVGNGEEMKSTSVDNLPVLVCDKFGKESQSATIKDVTVIPYTSFNMFSISRVVKDGCTLSGDDVGNGLILSKGGAVRVYFNIQIHTKKGVLYCACLKREIEDEIGAGAVEVKTKKLHIKTVHDQLGHCNEESVREVTWVMGWEVTQGTIPKI